MNSDKIIEDQATTPKQEYTDVPPIKFGEHDDFDREKIATNIISLLNSDWNDCYPMAIDGGWGTGKTEFCHKLINKMRGDEASQEKREVLYFDAFEAENIGDPLVSILAKITSKLPQKQKHSIAEQALPLARFLLKVGIKSGLAHALRQDIDMLSDEAKEILAGEANTVIDNKIEELLQEHNNAQAHIDALKISIQKAVEEKELVIFIDELDRCRPDFALNVLEVVKHIFNIDKVKFIFIINSEQIKSMIAHRYGHTVDTDVYLEKFIKFSINIPRITSKYQEFNASARYFELEMLKLQKKHLIGKRNYAYQFISDFIKNKNISLRGVERLSFSIKLYKELCPMRHLNSPLGDLGWSLFTLSGILIFTFDKQLSDKIIKKCSTKEDFYNFFGTSPRWRRQ